MEVFVNMGVMGKEESGRVPTFKVLGFYPGKARGGEHFPEGNHWLEWHDDKSALPVAHLMERAFRLNKMVVYKESSVATQKLVVAHSKKSVMEGYVSVSMSVKGSNVPVGRYKFDFKVTKINPRQSDSDGNMWDAMEIAIIDKTEDIGLAS